MLSYRCCMTVVALCVVGEAVANPERRSNDLEARRRSALDRSLVRFGRSFPAEPSAADIREALQANKRGTSFVRFGRSQPMTISSDDLISYLNTYDDDIGRDEGIVKRLTNFVRLGRDPHFIRFGRSEEKADEKPTELVVNGYPQRKLRAKDLFLRLGRSNEELMDSDEQVERKKRSTCEDC